MKMRAVAAILAAFSVCAAGEQAGAAGAAPEAFGALPTVSEAKISPNGQYVAMLQAVGKATAVVIYDLANPGSQPAGIGLGEVRARELEWADDDYVLLLASQTYDLPTSGGLKTIELWRWVSISRTKAKAAMLFGNDGGYYIPDAGDLLAVTPASPGDAVFSRWFPGRGAGGGGPSRLGGAAGGQGLALQSAKLNTGATHVETAGEANTAYWIVDANGEARIRVDYEDGRLLQKVYVRPDGASRFEQVTQFDVVRGEGTEIKLRSLSPKAGTAIAESYATSDTLGLVEFDLATGQPAASLFSNPTYDIVDVVYDPRLARVTGVRYIDDLPRTFHLDPADQKLQQDLAAALPGAAPMIVSRSADGTKMLVRAIYTDHPDQIFLFDKTARKLSILTPTYSGIDGKTYAAKEKFDYTASDGLRIHGYLTVPKGAGKANMPLIVLPHGGPEGRDDQSFDWWSFFYAARGYLVYQPNFRGSDGYGYKFRSAGFGEWGRKMQDDITEGVEKLIADGIADPSRICIVGASYGGYAALAGATLTPDLYACAVSVNGVSNLPGMIGEAARTSGDLSEDYWQVRIGSQFRDAAALNAVSPVKNAASAGAPIMIIHGRDDTVVPFGQAIQMRDALNAARKPVEFVELDGEDHWLSDGETRTRMLAKSIEFIDRHIGPGAGAAATAND